VQKQLKRGDVYVEVEMFSGQDTWPVFGSLQAFWPSLEVMTGDLDQAARTAHNFYVIWRQHGLTPEKVNYLTGMPLGGQSG
jgi:hypothetical protein